MIREVTIRGIGSSLGPVLPKDRVERLDLPAGDRILAMETDGGILLIPYEPDVVKA